MDIINIINDFFGIKSEVSAPIIITVLVFITGGICNFIYNLIKSRNEKKEIRELFRTMLEKIILDCEVKEKQTARFFPTLNSDHKEHWTLSFTRINYLYTLFELDFNRVFQAFETHYQYQCNKKLKKKAFHTIYSNLDNLKYFETFIKPDIEKFIADFNSHHDKYKDALSSFNEMIDEIRFNLNGVAVAVGTPIHNYIVEIETEWSKWLLLDPIERVHFKITYEMLVEPTLVLNRKLFVLPFILDMNKHLMECKNQYLEMENVLKRSNLTFKNHNFNYRASRRILKKSLKLIS